MSNATHSRLKKLAVCILAISASSTTFAAAYSIFGEASGKNAGDYGAGVAAEANDASTLYYNPAGLVLLPSSELSLNGTLVHVNSKFTGSVSMGNEVVNPPVLIENINSAKDEADNLPVPSMYYAHKVNNNLAWGVGVFVPFGLETDWSTDTALRYAATKTKLQVIDVSPAISARLSDTLAVGAAFDVQFANVEYDSVLGVPVQGIDFPDNTSENTGSSVGFAVHGGVMWQAQPNTRFGINYQSQAQHKFNGKSTFEGPLAGAALEGFDETNATTTDPVNFPAMTTFGVFHQASSKLGLMASASYVEWSSIKQLVLNNVVAPGGARSTIVAPQNYRNTWRIVGGARYQLNDKWLVRGGIGWDQTPTNDVDRDIRLPDGDRLGVAVGAHYQYSDKLGVDAGWTHLFMKGAQLNNSFSIGDGLINVITQGEVKGNADLFGAQLTWKVD